MDFWELRTRKPGGAQIPHSIAEPAGGAQIITLECQGPEKPRKTGKANPPLPSPTPTQRTLAATLFNAVI